jgi:5-(carboxyamino)imidazole ribonucleotide synthase
MDAKDLNDVSTIPFNGRTVLEEFIECQKEISVIVGVDVHGHTICFPSVEMQFDPQANLVTYLFSPALLTTEQEYAAQSLAIQTAKAFNSPGLFAVEMFLNKAGNLLVNETAPRPHNSGHHTIEACYSSQYEQLLRILLHLPLGSTELLKHAAMINVLGDTGFSGPYYLDNEADILSIEGVYIHLYGKKISKPKRKLGHITILADDTASLKQKVEQIQPLIQIKPIL